MSGSVQRTTSATPEDDVIRPRPLATQSSLAQNVVVDPAPQPPSEVKEQVVDATPKNTPKRGHAQWPRPTRAPKLDRPVPLSGAPLVWSWVLRLLVLIARVLTLGFVTVRRFSNPKLNKRDRWHYELVARKTRLKRNAIRRPRKVTVVNSKGGSGKTPTATYLGVFAQEYTGNPCTLIDINQNVGSTWRWVGVSQSDTITVFSAVTSPSFTNVDEFHAVTAIHQETGLRFISSEDMDTTTAVGAILKQDGADLGADDVQRKILRRFKAFIQNIKRFSHSVFIDTGNGMSHASNTAAVDASDVLVFPASWDDDDDIAGIQETVHGYISRGFGPKLRQRAFYMVYGSPNLKEEVIYERFCERVFAAYVAANFKGTSFAEMDPEYRKQKAREYAETLGITIDRLYLVPWSKYIAQKHVASAMISKVGMPTSLAIFHVLDDIYELNIDTDPAEATSSADIDAQLMLLNTQVQVESTTTTA